MSRAERRRADERGASLILAIFLLALLSLVVPALLGLTLTGARVTSSVVDDRAENYVATSALDAAVQHGRTAPWVGRFGLACPTMDIEIDGRQAQVTCTSATGAFDLDRTLTYEALVAGVPRGRVEVIFRDGTAGAGEPDVDVLSWDSRPNG